MTKRDKERQAWQEYYRDICRYERWRDFRGMTSTLISDMERRVRGLSNVEDYRHVQAVISAAKELNALVRNYAGKYCAKKPEKPLGRPYGADV